MDFQKNNPKIDAEKNVILGRPQSAFLGPIPIFWGPKTHPFRSTAIAGYLQITYPQEVAKGKSDV